jgi:hypothetical protein
MNALRPDAVEQLVAALMAPPQEGQCRCHWIDPTKLRILLWKNTDSQQPNTFILKIAEQKFIGFSRQDKKGEGYWKFRSFYEDKASEPAAPTTPSALSSQELALVESYHQKVKENKAMSDFSKAEVDAYCKWGEKQTAPETPPTQAPVKAPTNQENANSTNS